jgi:ketosteroid isomerase-like protein
MSQENVEIVRRIYEHLDTHQAFLPELFAVDFVADVSDVSLETSELHGVDAAQQAFGEYFGTFDDFRVEAEVLRADGHRVITAIRDGGRMRGSDARVANRYFHAWTLRDGKATRLSSHTDEERALEAVGLQEH